MNRCNGVRAVTMVTTVQASEKVYSGADNTVVPLSLIEELRNSGVMVTTVNLHPSLAL